MIIVLILMALGFVVLMAGMVGVLLFWRGSWGGLNQAIRIWILRHRFYPGPAKSEYHILYATRQSEE